MYHFSNKNFRSLPLPAHIVIGWLDRIWECSLCRATCHQQVMMVLIVKGML